MLHRLWHSSNYPTVQYGNFHASEPLLMLSRLPGLPSPPSPGYFLHTLQDLAPPGIFPEPPAVAGGGQGALLGVPSKGYISVSP